MSEPLGPARPKREGGSPPDAQESDARDLLDRAKAGDTDAVEILIQRYLPSLRRWARGRLPRFARDLKTTDDVVQDVFLHTLKRIGDLEIDHVGAFHAYLRQAVMNQIRDEIRRTNRRGVAEELPDDQRGGSPSPLDVAIAREAREEFWAENADPRRAYPFIAGSVGPYGAFLADGSEYRGNYGLTEDELVDFHRPRIAALVRAGADILACETIPSAAEARALASLLAELPSTRAWISFSCRDGQRLCDGSPFVESVRAVAAIPQLIAVGVNCTAPRHVPGLLEAIRGATDLPTIAYPNGGDRWDATTRRWTAHAAADRYDPAVVAGWERHGAGWLGGCCGTGPGDIHVLAEALAA